MSQDFKTRFEEMKHGDPTQMDNNESTDTMYKTISNVRNLCLVWPNNKKQFLNYSYLISCEYLPDEGIINLMFTTHTINLKGSNLDSLFDDFSCHLPRIIVCLGERYKFLANENIPAIESMTIHTNE